MLSEGQLARTAMNPIEARLVQAVQAFAARQAHFLSDHDTEAFAPAILAFRDEVDIAAREGVERWQAWHLISAWITDPKGRIYCLQRRLATQASDFAVHEVRGAGFHCDQNLDVRDRAF